MPLMVSGAEKRAIALYARQLGFELFGVTSPDRPPHYDVFSRWIAEGKQGQMEYLASERSLQRRKDPRLILPECRSILVLGTPYSLPTADNILDSPDISAIKGKVAAYAWGKDYHDVLPDRMQEIITFIEGLIGAKFPHRSYTDTGPLLERDLAQRAGLGWIGKNTCLINPERGSYFLLSEILLGLEIEPDSPFIHDRCGTCTRCRDACPTHCILPDRTVDARRCISYLTIELKGGIPKDLRPLMGRWVFGCDICQEVCPWNQRHAKFNADLAFAPREGVLAPDLIHELSQITESFSFQFAKSPVKRSRRTGYLRNVAVCLGNSRDPKGIPALGDALSDPEPIVREHAAWALGQIGGNDARLLLELTEQQETDPGVRDEVLSALAWLSR